VILISTLPSPYNGMRLNLVIYLDTWQLLWQFDSNLELKSQAVASNYNTCLCCMEMVIKYPQFEYDWIRPALGIKYTWLLMMEF
jgi:hypothetical protein